MKYLLLALVALTLPLTAVGADKPHMKTVNQDCAECHVDQEKVWMDGKHGLMGVKCVVCHGSPEVNFTAKPGLNRCRGCHGDAVVDVQKKLPAKDRTCFLCHEHHTAAVKESAKNKTGFHGQGGGK
ncbi:MAG: hypothetical protein AABZ10_05750 [Nitrospirota bacterium]